MNIVVTCPHGHELRSTTDRDGTGYCRKCRADADRARRARHRAALDLARELADRVVLMDDVARVQLVEIATKLQALVA